MHDALMTSHTWSKGHRLRSCCRKLDHKLTVNKVGSQIDRKSTVSLFLCLPFLWGPPGLLLRLGSISGEKWLIASFAEKTWPVAPRTRLIHFTGRLICHLNEGGRGRRGASRTKFIPFTEAQRKISSSTRPNCRGRFLSILRLFWV